MKDALLPLAFVIIMGAGIWYYISVSAQRDANARALGAASAEQAAPAVPVKKPAPAIRRVTKPEPVAEVAPPPESVPVEIAKLSRAPQPVPSGTLSDIKPGMEASQVVDLLGEPKLTTMTADRGGLLETYVYKPGDRILMIRLRGGRVEAR
jgi:hypothetical protein